MFINLGNLAQWKRDDRMKKYLLLVEDEGLWEKFKSLIEKDLNTAIMELIEKKVKEGKR
jgi:hypothetical protein